MSAQENPYHCKDCGFCRVGGQDMFRHCDGCGMCIDVEVFHDHNCQSGKYMANCPVCYEDLFSSRNLTHVSSNIRQSEAFLVKKMFAEIYSYSFFLYPRV